jgi:hypothetical protein
VENALDGRPIAKLLLKKPLQLGCDSITHLIELIPPHLVEYQSIYKPWQGHIRIVRGETFAEFGKTYAHILTGQQDQGPFCQPYFITFPDYSAVKFYQCSLQEVCILEGKSFDGFYHAME